ncbi:DUF397 domain-containing protein [Actinomadura meyerae]|uniref:DUF397 domain-containing protein n=1 Tax=Actinomadura meyerae TaxID=240840 RepID=UPI000B78CD03|nr:DUF397 domain-containing protein [Actinomadura meyerae]
MTSRERYVGWRKSSYSGTGNNCVEAARAGGGRVGVRDTAARHAGCRKMAAPRGTGESPIAPVA